MRLQRQKRESELVLEPSSLLHLFSWRLKLAERGKGPGRRHRHYLTCRTSEKRALKTYGRGVVGS